MVGSAISASNHGPVLLFSGGRDSTISALRLAEAGSALHLVTIASGHLCGLDRVRCRLDEIRAHLPAGSTWQCIEQPLSHERFDARFQRTCLPCQRDYVAVGVEVARAMGVTQVALGYALYQSDWPEQHPSAVDRLRARLAEIDISLLLPVYDLESRAEAERELSERGVSPEALEQKCLKQITNERLARSELVRHLDHWESKLVATLNRKRKGRLRLLDDLRFSGEFGC